MPSYPVCRSDFWYTIFANARWGRTPNCRGRQISRAEGRVCRDQLVGSPRRGVRIGRAVAPRPPLLRPWEASQESLKVSFLARHWRRFSSSAPTDVWTRCEQLGKHATSEVDVDVYMNDKGRRDFRRKLDSAWMVSCLLVFS